MTPALSNTLSGWVDLTASLQLPTCGNLVSGWVAAAATNWVKMPGMFPFPLENLQLIACGIWTFKYCLSSGRRLVSVVPIIIEWEENPAVLPRRDWIHSLSAPLTCQNVSYIYRETLLSWFCWLLFSGAHLTQESHFQGLEIRQSISMAVQVLRPVFYFKVKLL